MSAPTKLRGGSESQLTKLKVLWRDSLTEDARDYWRALFISAKTQAEVRQEIAVKLKIKLSYDKQLNQFRKWLAEQDARDTEAEAMADDERRLQQQFGEQFTKEEIRAQVIKAAYARTLASGEFGLGLATAKVDLKAEETALAREKFKESLRKKLETALDALAEHIKGNPKAQAAYDEFRRVIAESTK